MKGPESHRPMEVLKEDAWKVLQRETEEGGFVSALITARGIVRSDTSREVLEYVRDEVTRDIVKLVVDLENFCDWGNFREAVYMNKITDFCRRGGLAPSVDWNGADVSQLEAKTRPEGASHSTMAHLEAADELFKIIQSIENKEHRRRLGVVFRGIMLGWSHKEIIDELERIEGKRVAESRIPQMYAYFRKRYLVKKFPHIPATLDGLRSLIEPRHYEVVGARAERVKGYFLALSKELERLAGEKQTEQTGEDILVIEYLLGKRSAESLATQGLSTPRDRWVARERIGSRLGIPFQDLRRSVFNNIER